MGKEKFDDFLVNTGLYIAMSFSGDDINELAGILSEKRSGIGVYKFDSYCPYCEKESIFSIESTVYHHGSFYLGEFQNKNKQISATCSRNVSHKILYFFITTDDTIQKIGQFPPVPDILSQKIVKYKNTLKKDFIELKTAIQLYSHGVGIGSFVYLRRVFENLIIGAFEENKASIVDSCKFYTKRMDERIIMIKPYIPSFIANNSAIYGILSKGIHELDEFECLDFFPVLNESIEMILDQKLRMKEEREKEKLLSQTISSISSKINSKTE